MTNEEIERELDIAAASYDLELGGQSGKPRDSHIADAVRRLIVRAYEEAASIAENWGSEDDEPTDPDVAFSCLAAAIRAEKPRPLQASVLST